KYIIMISFLKHCEKYTTLFYNLVIPRDVLEGNNVTLEATNENVERNDTVSWTLSEDCRSKRIAQWKNFTIFINEGFEDVLQMNQHNGSLTLIKVTKNNAGIYLTFLLFNLEHVSKPHITTAQTNISTPPVDDGSCYINCSVKNTPNVTLTWYKEEEKINQTNNLDIAVDLILPLDIQNHNEYTYSCVAANPVINKTDENKSTFQDEFCSCLCQTFIYCIKHFHFFTGPGINYYYIIIVLVVVGLIAVWYKRRRIQRNNEGQAGM
uniref:Ig-like domain-containing protein n=1 Tax=Anabas testudineus TaxID=64144 RepID=A0A3Q1H641_ANATE